MFPIPNRAEGGKSSRRHPAPDPPPTRGRPGISRRSLDRHPCRGANPKCEADSALNSCNNLPAASLFWAPPGLHAFHLRNPGTRHQKNHGRNHASDGKYSTVRCISRCVMNITAPGVEVKVLLREVVMLRTRVASAILHPGKAHCDKDSGWGCGCDERDEGGIFHESRQACSANW